MKSQIGDLRKYISVIKTGLAKQQTPAAVEIQEPSAPEVPVSEHGNVRKGAARFQHTGLVVYIHSSVSKIVRRRPDLESEAVESVWLEIQTRKSSILVGYIYRNPASTFDWYDQFFTVMDRVQGCNLYVVLWGDFNIDMQKSNPAWDSTISLFALNQMIASLTRITPHSSTLIDHIYTSVKYSSACHRNKRSFSSVLYLVCQNCEVRSECPLFNCLPMFQTV